MAHTEVADSLRAAALEAYRLLEQADTLATGDSIRLAGIIPADGSALCAIRKGAAARRELAKVLWPQAVPVQTHRL